MMARKAMMADSIGAELEMEDYRAAKHVAVVGLETCAMSKSPSPIGVTRVGELDQKLWPQVWSKVFPGGRGVDARSADQKRAKMARIWEDFLAEKQSWSELVTALKEQPRNLLVSAGEKIYEEVMTSMKEVDDFIGDAHCIMKLEAWNWEEDREATLAEVIHQFLGVLKEIGDEIEALFQKVEAKDVQIYSGVRGASSRVPEETKAEQATRSWIQWIGAFPFDAKDAIAFQRKRAALNSKVGVAAEMQEAREEGFKALLAYGNVSAIGVRELGYLGLETMDEVADEWNDILLMRYQNTDFPHRIKAPKRAPRYCLPPGYSGELKALGGTKYYPSAACAEKETMEQMSIENPCSYCHTTDAELGRNNMLTSKVLFCRDCLAPQAWNYKQGRKAGVGETMAYLVGVILLRESQLKALRDVWSRYSILKDRRQWS